MINRIGKLTCKTAMAAIMALSMGLVASPSPVQAQSLVRNAPHYEDVPGCNQRVKNAFKFVSQVNAIRDVQLVEETIMKPESVYHMTCFARAGGDQILNAANTRRDRYLWQTGTGERHADRADRKVRTWATNTWLRNNYAQNLIGNEVAENCTALQAAWTFQTGNGAKRFMLEREGTPNPGAGAANRPDRDFFLDLDDIWIGGGAPTDAWGVDDQQASIINGQANTAIDRMEDDIFAITDNIQPDILDIGYRDFTSAENPALTCVGDECLTTQDLLDLFNNIQP